jgi:ketosteroid isomerase-like protein
MSETPVLAVVRSWHEAMNARDTERLVALAHDDVEVAGPRGVGRGTGLLRAWMDRQTGEAGLHLETRRYFVRGDTVVVDQLAGRSGRCWSSGTAAWPPSPATPTWVPPCTPPALLPPTRSPLASPGPRTGP